MLGNVRQPKKIALECSVLKLDEFADKSDLARRVAIEQ